jgi:hypothetical protein
MDRIWQWAWDRYGAKYSWVIWLVAFAVLSPPYLVWSLVIVDFEKSSHYVEASAFTAVAAAVMAFVLILPGSRRFRLMQLSAAAVRDLTGGVGVDHGIEVVGKPATIRAAYEVGAAARSLSSVRPA